LGGSTKNEVKPVPRHEIREVPFQIASLEYTDEGRKEDPSNLLTTTVIYSTASVMLSLGNPDSPMVRTIFAKYSPVFLI
jgi:hypothetical protein